jgi:hypothetical protein
VLKVLVATKLKMTVILVAALVWAGSGLLACRAPGEEPASQPEPPGRAEDKADPPLSPEQFAELHQLIKPLPGQLAWRDEIPWLTRTQEAREKAAAAGKPLLIWVASDGQPLGSC